MMNDNPAKRARKSYTLNSQFQIKEENIDIEDSDLSTSENITEKTVIKRKNGIKTTKSIQIKEEKSGLIDTSPKEDMKLQSEIKKEFSETNADQGLELTNEGFDSVYEMKNESTMDEVKMEIKDEFIHQVRDLLKCNFCQEIYHEVQHVEDCILYSNFIKCENLEFQCKICLTQFLTRTKIVDHIKKKHSNPKTGCIRDTQLKENLSQPCYLCNEIFFSLPSHVFSCRILSKCMKSKSNSFQCLHCKHKYDSYKLNKMQARIGMFIHIVSEHPKEITERDLNSDACSKDVEDAQEVVRDTSLSVHDGTKPYACSLCKKSYARKEAIIHHFKTVHEENSIDQSLLPDDKSLGKCDFCQELYFEPQHFEDCILYSNFFIPKDLKFQCKFCPIKLPSRMIMFHHIKIKHYNVRTGQATNLPAERLPQKCRLCQELFYNLRNHIFLCKTLLKCLSLKGKLGNAKSLQCLYCTHKYDSYNWNKTQNRISMYIHVASMHLKEICTMDSNSESCKNDNENMCVKVDINPRSLSIHNK